MSKIKNTGIDVFRRFLLLVIAATFFLLSISGTFVYAADSHEYTLRYPPLPGGKSTQQQIQNEIKNSGIGEGGGGLENTDILANGNKFDGIQFNFDRNISDDYDMLIYTKDVYCTLRDTKVTTSAPPSDQLYIRYKMAVGIYPGGTGGTLFGETEYSTWAGPADRAEHYLHLPSYTYNAPLGSSNESFNLEDSKHDTGVYDGHGKKVNGDNTEAVNTKHEIDGNFKLNNGQDAALFRFWPELYQDFSEEDFQYAATRFPDSNEFDYDEGLKKALQPLVTKCLPSKKDGKLTSNYEKLSDEDKKTWKATGDAVGAPGANGKTPPGSNPDCDSADGGPLQWIICPIIDLGANFTDGVFRNFVRPLLEDIPIGSDPSDGGYRAWQGFRSLGNIMLAGFLLAIVYAQARGDK